MAVETKQRASVQDQLAPPSLIRFDSLRDDWIKGADVLVRLIARSTLGEIVLQGFPLRSLCDPEAKGAVSTRSTAPLDLQVSSPSAFASAGFYFI
jgi:hypothetical protein